MTNTLMIDGFMLIQMQLLMSFSLLILLNPTAATQYHLRSIVSQLVAATGFLADWLPSLICVVQVFLGGPCSLLVLPVLAPLLAALVKYQNTDAGLVYQIFWPSMYSSILWLRLYNTSLPCN